MGKSSTSFKKGEPRPKNAGRKKGTPNVQPTFTSMREELILVYNELGGWPAFYEWGRKNQTMFYQMMTKLLPPQQVPTGPISGEILHRVVYGQPLTLDQPVHRIEEKVEREGE